jgi:4'-phosphopantetheinyl transferase
MAMEGSSTVNTAPETGSARLAALDGAAHVWTALVDGRAPEMTARFAAWLSDDEQQRRARYRRAEDARLFVCARGLLRYALSQYADVAPAAWRFLDQRGTRLALNIPFDTLPLQFSVSHTPGLVACAVTRDVPLGIDVEGAARISDISNMMDLVCSPAEQRELAALVPAERNARFHELWTLKEACVKALGTGLTLPVSGVTFRRSTDGIAVEFASPVGSSPAHWQFATWRASSAHVGALAIRRGNAPDLRVVFQPEFSSDPGHANG